MRKRMARWAAAGMAAAGMAAALTAGQGGGCVQIGNNGDSSNEEHYFAGSNGVVTVYRGNYNPETGEGGTIVAVYTNEVSQ